MIEVENLTKRYGAFTAIEGMNFSLKQGEIVGFLGVNGAGKTTTMRVLAGYMPPSEGRASIAGYDVLKQSLEARRHTGYMPETVPLYTEMRVYDYLDYMARLRGLRHRREARIWQVMELVNIDHLHNRIVGTLSKGQKQRVGIAQAIVHNPDVLILDEPTIGLDPRQIREVRGLIRELGKVHTILLSTHILPEAAQTCDRVLIVANGCIRADMTISEATRTELPSHVTVRADAPAEEMGALLRGLPHVEAVVPSLDGSFEVTRNGDAEQIDLRPAIARAVTGRGWGLLELRGTGVALEDLFLRLTQEDLRAGASDEGADVEENEEEDEYEDAEEADDDDEAL